MPGDVTMLPAVQARSQQTRNRLLDAAEALLREGGLESATVPAIAERAGVAVGSVYRRFSDKDAVLRSIYERFFARSIAANREAFADHGWHSLPLEQAARRLVDGMVRGYRFHAPLLAPLIRYAETHPDAEFRRRAEQLRAEVFAGIAPLLLSRRGEIAHPVPEEAVAFLLLMLGLALKGLVLRGDRLDTPIPWNDVSRELQRVAVNYLELPVIPPA
jgi:AcrR family transcriptional regulator